MRMRFLAVAFLFLSALGAFAQQPVNVVTVAGSAPSTAGKLDVKAADGDVFVRCNAASTCPVNANESGTWSVEMQDGAGNALTSNSTTYSSKHALDANMLGTLGTAFSTAGKVDVKGADGDVFVRQTTGSNLHVVCDSGCGSITTISLVPATSGGLTMGHAIAAASNNATALKGSAGQLYAASVYNNAAYPVYLKFCNKATACTCGTNSGSDTILFTVAAQAGTEREIHTEEGIAFSTGISYCGVKNMVDTDNTSLAVNDAVFDFLYK